MIPKRRPKRLPQRKSVNTLRQIRHPAIAAFYAELRAFYSQPLSLEAYMKAVDDAAQRVTKDLRDCEDHVRVRISQIGAKEVLLWASNSPIHELDTLFSKASEVGFPSDIDHVTCAIAYADWKSARGEFEPALQALRMAQDCTDERHLLQCVRMARARVKHASDARERSAEPKVRS